MSNITRVRVRRVTNDTLPQFSTLGELIYNTDTKILYIGKGDKLPLEPINDFSEAFWKLHDKTVENKESIEDVRGEIDSKVEAKAEEIKGEIYPKVDNNTTKISEVRNELDSIKDQVSQNKPIIINDDIPLGSIIFRDKTVTLPSGWLICDGSTLSKTDYPDLFEVLKYTYGGSGDSFKLPNLVMGDNLVIIGSDSNDQILNELPNQQGIIKAKQLSSDMHTIAQEVDQVKGEHSTLGVALNSKYADKKEFEDMKEQIVQNKPIVITDDYPVGGFMWFTMSTVPNNFLLCNGQSVSKLEYSDLYSVLGGKYGENETHFNVPNLLEGNRFIRATSEGWIGTLQPQGTKDHHHRFVNNLGQEVWLSADNAYWDSQGNNTLLINGGSFHPNKIPSGMDGSPSHPNLATIPKVGGILGEDNTETRPSNIQFLPCIKAKQLAKDMQTVGQEWTSFKEKGGAIGGTLDIKGGINLGENSTELKKINIQRQATDGNVYNSLIATGSTGTLELQLLNEDYNIISRIGLEKNTVTLNKEGGSLNLETSGTIRGENLQTKKIILENTDGEAGISQRYKDMFFKTNGKDRCVVNEWNFRPNTTGSLGLGDPQTRWNNLYLTEHLYALGYSRDRNGYTKLTNGMIMQWGKVVVDHTNSNMQYVNYPIAFPTDSVNLTGTFSVYDSNGNSRIMATQVLVNNKVNFKYRVMKIGLPLENTISSVELWWFAIGY